jgi:metal-responsive CopG/Arc/MetJ family transcriptional regulator
MTPTAKRRGRAEIMGISFWPGQIGRIDAAAELAQTNRSEIVRRAVEALLAAEFERPQEHQKARRNV